MNPGSRDRLSRRLFVVSLAFLLLGGAFAYGAVAQREDLPPIPQLRDATQTVRGVSDNDVTNHPRRHHLQPSRGQGSGVTVDETTDDDLVLMAGFFDEENQVRAVARDGTVVHRWSLDYHRHFPDPETRPCTLDSPLQVDTHGMHLTPQAELVVNYEYCGTVKLDRCGEVVWSIDRHTHHSLVPAASGGYWILGQDRWRAADRPDRSLPGFTPGAEQLVLEDTVLRVSEDGEVLGEVSVPGLMHDNGLEALLSADGIKVEFDRSRPWELVHTNKVTELPSELADAYPMFAAGDLAISLRALNLVMVVEPATWHVKWHQVGPWLRQHDPEFRPDGRISIFNNNVYWGIAYDDEEQTILSTPYTTNILAVDPATQETEVVFGEAPGQEMLSVIRGDHELLEGDGMLLTEFDGGRVLQVDAEGRILWEYVNEYDDDRVGEVTNALLVDAETVTSETETSC